MAGRALPFAAGNNENVWKSAVPDSNLQRTSVKDVRDSHYMGYEDVSRSLGYHIIQIQQKPREPQTVTFEQCQQFVRLIPSCLA